MPDWNTPLENRRRNPLIADPLFGGYAIRPTEATTQVIRKKRRGRLQTTMASLAIIGTLTSIQNAMMSNHTLAISTDLEM